MNEKNKTVRNYFIVAVIFFATGFFGSMFFGLRNNGLAREARELRKQLESSVAEFANVKQELETSRAGINELRKNYTELENENEQIRQTINSGIGASDEAARAIESSIEIVKELRGQIEAAKNKGNR